MTEPLTVADLPCDANPYQNLLYADYGLLIEYLAPLTPSHMLNRLLLQLKVVCTAHNVLPHEQVFDDHPARRRMLVGSADLPARLMVAGACEDGEYATRLRVACAAATGPRVELRLGSLTEVELDALLTDSDVLVLLFPYLEVTMSGSAVLGLGAGLPVLVPDLPGFADLPDDAVLRNPPGELAAALARVVELSRSDITRMGKARRATIAAHTWSKVAARTAKLYRGLLRTGVAG